MDRLRAARNKAAAKKAKPEEEHSQQEEEELSGNLSLSNALQCISEIRSRGSVLNGLEKRIIVGVETDTQSLEDQFLQESKAHTEVIARLRTELEDLFQRAPRTTAQAQIASRKRPDDNEAFVLVDALMGLRAVRCDHANNEVNPAHLKALRGAIAMVETLVDPLVGRGAEDVPSWAPEGLSVDAQLGGLAEAMTRTHVSTKIPEKSSHLWSHTVVGHDRQVEQDPKPLDKDTNEPYDFEAKNWEARDKWDKKAPFREMVHAWYADVLMGYDAPGPRPLNERDVIRDGEKVLLKEDMTPIAAVVEPVEEREVKREEEDDDAIMTVAGDAGDAATTGADDAEMTDKPIKQSLCSMGISRASWN